MYTSDTDISGGTSKTAFVYLMVSLFCALFGAVYEIFSHEVYSFYMIYAFVFPLAGGTLPFLAIGMFRKHDPGAIARHLYHFGIATLTVGSIMQGVLDIYGTTNHLTGLYWRVGIILLIAGIVLYLRTAHK